MTARLIMKLRVAERCAITSETIGLTLEHPRRPLLPAWSPGAHVDLRLPDGRVRQYSLVGDPADRSRYRIAIKREPGGRGASIWAHQTLQRGAEAHISAPRNNFPLQPGGRAILLAGGIGVTPLLPMARELARQGREFVFHFCARSRAQAPLLEELETVCGPRLTTWFSADCRRFDPASLAPYTDGAQLYLCGPPGLMALARAAVAARAWPEAGLHSEIFQPTSDANFKPEPFEARIASTGARLHVPADRSLLDILREAGFTLQSACENGLCGACECGYRDGAVIHRDQILAVAARQYRLTPCVSRARASVTLDL